MSLVAHGIGGIQDLPVPGWLFYWGAAIVLVVSFVLLGVLWREPLLASHEKGRPLSKALSRAVLGPLRIVVQFLSVAVFGVVFAAALLGDTDPFRNLAPTWIYVIFWLGVPALSVVLGNVWRALSPWRPSLNGGVWKNTTFHEAGAARRRSSSSQRSMGLPASTSLRWTSRPTTCTQPQSKL